MQRGACRVQGRGMQGVEKGHPGCAGCQGAGCRGSQVASWVQAGHSTSWCPFVHRPYDVPSRHPVHCNPTAVISLVTARVLPFRSSFTPDLYRHNQTSPPSLTPTTIISTHHQCYPLHTLSMLPSPSTTIDATLSIHHRQCSLHRSI